MPAASQTGSSAETIELKQGRVFSFDDGVLTIKTAGHGAQNGWGTLAFHERQAELDADGFYNFDIPPSELRELRDFLNRVFPAVVAKPVDPRDPDPSRPGIFRDHNCSRCNSGAKPCVSGSPNRCEYPHARND